MKIKAYSPFVPLATVLGLALLAVGCGRGPSDLALPTNVVARIADQAISVAALEQELARRHLARPTEAEIAAALDDLVRLEVLYASARQAGYDRKPEVQAAIRRLLVAEYRQSLETNLVSPAQITSAEIENYYRSHTERYQAPEQARAALILLPLSAKATPEKEAEAHQQAEAIRAQALAGAEAEATFGLLAQTNSAHQPTRYRGGNLGWLTREAAGRDWEPALVNTLFGLQQAGQISPVVRGKDGLYLFKLIERKPASLRPLAEVQDAIAYHLAREQAAQREGELYARLKTSVDIRINEAVLARLITNVPPADAPPSLPSQ